MQQPGDPLHRIRRIENARVDVENTKLVKQEIVHVPSLLDWFAGQIRGDNRDVSPYPGQGDVDGIVGTIRFVNGD